MVGNHKYIKQKVDAGVLSLDKISDEQLMQMAQEATSVEDKDFLGDQIMYVRRDFAKYDGVNRK